MKDDLRARRLGTILVALGAIDEEGARRAADLAGEEQCRFGDACLRLGLVERGAIVRALSLQSSAPSVALGPFLPDPSLAACVPGSLARKHRLLPLALVSGAPKKLVVATSRPGDLEMQDELAFVTGCRIAVVVAADDELDRAIEEVYGLAPLDDRRTYVDLENGPGFRHVTARYGRVLPVR